MAYTVTEYLYHTCRANDWDIRTGTGVPTDTVGNPTIHLSTDTGIVWTNSESGWCSQWMSKQGSIANASVRTMYTTPVSMLAAPGTGLYYEVQSVHWFMDYATAAFDAAGAGDTLNAKYTDGSGAAVVDPVAGDVIGGAVADYHTVVHAVAEVIPVANAAIVAHIATGEWFAAAGGGVLKYEITYRIRSLEW